MAEYQATRPVGKCVRCSRLTDRVELLDVDRGPEHVCGVMCKVLLQQQRAEAEANKL